MVKLGWCWWLPDGIRGLGGRWWPPDGIRQLAATRGMRRLARFAVDVIRAASNAPNKGLIRCI